MMNVSVTLFIILWLAVALFFLFFIIDEAILQPYRNRKISKELEVILKKRNLTLKKAKDIFRTRLGTIKYIDSILKELDKSIMLNRGNNENNEVVEKRVQTLLDELEAEKKFQMLPIEIQSNFQSLDKTLNDNVDLNLIVEKLPKLLRKKESWFKKVTKIVIFIFAILGAFSSIITIMKDFTVIKEFIIKLFV